MTRSEELGAYNATLKEKATARIIQISRPHYIVTAECATNCRKLRRVAKEAQLMAFRHPDCQIVVIGHKHGRLGCSAHAIIEGMWEYNWGDETTNQPVFLPNPGSYHEQIPATVSGMIEQALRNGAQDYDELPPL